MPSYKFPFPFEGRRNDILLFFDVSILEQTETTTLQQVTGKINFIVKQQCYCIPIQTINIQELFISAFYFGITDSLKK